MKIKFKVLITLALIFTFLNNCSNKNITSDIQGLWISNEESSHLFTPGAQEVALMIKSDSTKLLSARGFFLNNGEFEFEWHFTRVKYDIYEKKISILDSDSDTLILALGPENKLLEGAIHLQNKEKKPIGFSRANKELEIRLFHPRVPEENGQVIYHYSKPEQIDDGLETGSFYSYTSDSLSISNLMKEVIDQKFGKLKSLLILKNNKLILEEYFYGYNRNELQQTRSCSKSVTSILLGIALDRHKDVNVNQSIFSFFPDYISLKTEVKEKITLKHVLTMMSGFEWDDIPSDLFKADDCFQYILSRPLESEPGEKFNYNSGCSILLGGIISYLEKIKTEDFVKNSLFLPLGISEYSWETHKDGTLQCGSGLSLRPRDMAKIGLLVLNDGKWQEKQLVSKEWIRKSTRPHVSESPYFDYGYQWWHRSKNTLQWWKEPNSTSPDEHDLITALGHGGQYIIIIRDLNLVIVTTAFDFYNGAVARSKIPMVIEKIIPIFEND